MCCHACPPPPPCPSQVRRLHEHGRRPTHVLLAQRRLPPDRLVHVRAFPARMQALRRRRARVSPVLPAAAGTTRPCTSSPSPSRTSPSRCSRRRSSESSSTSRQVRAASNPVRTCVPPLACRSPHHATRSASAGWHRAFENWIFWALTLSMVDLAFVSHLRSLAYLFEKQVRRPPQRTRTCTWRCCCQCCCCCPCHPPAGGRDDDRHGHLHCLQPLRGLPRLAVVRARLPACEWGEAS